MEDYAVTNDSCGGSPHDSCGGSPHDRCGGSPRDSCNGSSHDRCGSSPRDSCNGSSHDRCGSSPHDRCGGSPHDGCHRRQIKMQNSVSLYLALLQQPVKGAKLPSVCRCTFSVYCRLAIYEKASIGTCVPSISKSAVVAQIEWPWTPNESDLDLGDLADLHNIHKLVSILEDRQHHTLALKDLTTHVCYLIDMQTSHMTTQEILNDIKLYGDRLLSVEFYAQFPPIDHAGLTQFGHRISHYCKHNPTITLGIRSTMITPHPVGN
ncbi:uncharacterized protein LOC121378087 [Gigantopelta aegis]|uniref:uncharacterized protein LOC121378087 n=1 Tax=Gigantopelta aegis TaxID=1735272 RepID=UPI001B88D318|nr:uncharacterized protein LOC121378087 [Gigantopelta aegis]